MDKSFFFILDVGHLLLNDVSWILSQKVKKFIDFNLNFSLFHEISYASSTFGTSEWSDLSVVLSYQYLFYAYHCLYKDQFISITLILYIIELIKTEMLRNSKSIFLKHLQKVLLSVVIFLYDFSGERCENLIPPFCKCWLNAVQLKFSLFLKGVFLMVNL